MCGRYALTATPEEIRALFGYIDMPDFPPRYNIAPTQPVAIVRSERGQRRFVLVRWGFVPAWVKEPKSFALLFNARAEGAVDKPAFRAAMRYRRCLFPASGFYEWRRLPGGGKQAFWVRPRGGGLLALAGIWETWSARDGSEIDSAAILTTGSNATLAPIHDRMPVIIAPQDFERWLASPEVTPAEVADLLRPVPDSLLEAIPVGDRVNAARNDGPDLQTPVAAAG
jgi:putative SOS response-associated peptidase YedK